MGLFDYKDKVGPGVSKNAETAPWYVTFFKVLVERFANLVALNLLYLFCCLPIFTIGSATAGFTYVLRNYSQRKHVDMLYDFISKCKEHFKKGLLITLVDGLILVALVCGIDLWSSGKIALPGALSVIFLVITLYFAYLFLATNLYLFPMLVSFDLPLKKLVRNSLILASAKIWRNLAMLLVDGAVIGLCVVFWPIPLPVFLCIAFSFCGLFNNSLIYPVLVKHVATPAEEKPTDDEERIFTDTI